MTGYINAINVNMDEVDTHVANVKTSNKNLKAKCVSHRYKYSVNTNYEAIQIYATRKGTYYVTFDIVDGNGNCISTEQTRVIVESLKDSFKGYKSIKVGKKNILKKCLEDDYTAKFVDLNTAGKLKIKMKKGYLLKDIRVERWVKSESPRLSSGGNGYADLEYLHLNNGDVLKLSEVCEYHNGEVWDEIKAEKYGDFIFTYTDLIITYIDKRGIERENTITIRSKVK